MQFRDYKSKVLKTIDDEDPLDSGMRCVVFSDSFANFLQIFNCIKNIFCKYLTF